MGRTRMHGKGINAIKKDKIIKSLTSDFEEDPTADKANLVNEKELNRVINQITKQNKKKHKLIDTRCLLKSVTH